MQIENPEQIIRELESNRVFDLCELCFDELLDIEEDEKFQNNINRAIEVMQSSKQ